MRFMDCEKFEHEVKEGTTTGKARLVGLRPFSPSQELLMIVLEKKNHWNIFSWCESMIRFVSQEGLSHCRLWQEPYCRPGNIQAPFY